MANRQGARRVQVALFPPAPADRDAYLALLAQALTRAGADVVSTNRFSPRWARESCGGIDVIHLHWLEFLAPADRRAATGWLRTVGRGARLIWALRTAKRDGTRLVWTVHNLQPHEPIHPRVEFLLSKMTLRLVNEAIVHSEYARERVIARYGFASKLHVIPHGNYIDVYPMSPFLRSDIRRQYGIPDDAFVYLAFGQVRPYKRLTELIAAFASLKDHARFLVIAGESRDPELASRLEALAATTPNVLFDQRKVPMSDVQPLHLMADAAVFAYADLFSSGAAMLALSLGVPIVVPAHSTGTELGSAPAVEAIGPSGLSDALRRVATGDPQARRALAIDAAKRSDWAVVAKTTLEVYGAQQGAADE